MIFTAYYSTRADGVRLFITYSDINHYIIQDQTGIKYESAIDVENSGYTYTESDEEIIHDAETEQPGDFSNSNPDDVTPNEVMEALEELL